MDTAQIGKAKDGSTQRLFSAIEFAAGMLSMSIVEYIAKKRILVCNAWPWFRCGQEPSGDAGIHADFSTVPEVKSYLTALVNCLKPCRIGTLGDWAYNRNPSDLHNDIRNAQPSWFIRKFLSGTSFSRYNANQPEIRQFYHPAFWSSWNRYPRWFSVVTPFYGPYLNNRLAFVEFLA